MSNEKYPVFKRWLMVVSPTSIKKWLFRVPGYNEHHSNIFGVHSTFFLTSALRYLTFPPFHRISAANLGVPEVLPLSFGVLLAIVAFYFQGPAGVKWKSLPPEPPKDLGSKRHQEKQQGNSRWHRHIIWVVVSNSFLIFTSIWGNDPFWRIFFNGVETTN